ncbi:putative gastrotropin [Scophthalmus maximus]|uniref:Putative gastrotropin n=1 Tax=Scophthalmus maximus TaxID=52904 RepID=A0A2U9C7K2_SCOMX|nr:putative gastrotropin [Scophthalmus maximus]
MAFTGKYELESQENYEEFLDTLGLLNAKTDHKVVTEVVQDGHHFTWTQSIPKWTWSNTFTIGQECELVTMKSSKFKATVTMDGGKVVIPFPQYHFTAEINGDKLVMFQEKEKCHISSIHKRPHCCCAFFSPPLKNCTSPISPLRGIIVPPNSTSTRLLNSVQRPTTIFNLCWCYVKKVYLASVSLSVTRGLVGIHPLILDISRGESEGEQSAAFHAAAVQKAEKCHLWFGYSSRGYDSGNER